MTMTIAQRLINSCRKTPDGCVCSTKLTAKEWESAGATDTERLRNLEAIGRSAGKVGCDCHCTSVVINKTTLIAKCSADPTERVPVKLPTL